MQADSIVEARDGTVTHGRKVPTADTVDNGSWGKTRVPLPKGPCNAPFGPQVTEHVSSGHNDRSHY